MFNKHDGIRREGYGQEVMGKGGRGKGEEKGVEQWRDSCNTRIIVKQGLGPLRIWKLNLNDDDDDDENDLVNYWGL